MTSRRGVGVALLVIGVAFVLDAVYIDHRVKSPVLRVSAPLIPGATIDTVVVLPSTGRYEVRLDFVVAPGNERARVFELPLPLVFQADIGGRSWSTDSTAGYLTGDLSGGRWLGGPFRARGGERMHFVARAQPSMAALGHLQPYIELRRFYVEEMKVSDEATTRLLGGIISIVVGLVFWVRGRARGERKALPD